MLRKSASRRFLFVLLVLSEELARGHATELRHRPVVLWHGMGDTCCSPVLGGTADAARSQITEVLGNVYVKSLSIGRDMKADYLNGFFLQPDQQVAEACTQIQSDPNLTNGYNAVGFSQGGLFLRAVAQRCPDPPMRVLVTLGAPHQGIFGVPKCPAGIWLTCEFLRIVLNFAAYRKYTQRDFVPASYWHDPIHDAAYRDSGSFLADINNERGDRPEYGLNLQKLQKFVMIKFRKDSIIEPVASQWFEFYAPGQDKVILALHDSDIYIKDKLGLKTLMDSGRLQMIDIDNEHLLYSRSWFFGNVIHHLRS